MWQGEARTAEVVLAAADPEGTGKGLPKSVKVIRLRGPREELRRALSRAETAPARYRSVAALAPENDELHVLCTSMTAVTWTKSLWSEALTIGIGSAVPPEESARSFRTADAAVKRATEGRPIVSWEDLTESGLISLVAPETREHFAEELLGRLDDTPTGRTELTRIAISFVRHHGKVHAVADEVGMHRNTVRTRIREIETALDTNLDDPTARLNLWAALQIADDRMA
ncbi:helix-turn-helix domain-containing protein [Saccharopolyspora sp. NPDC050389]|uniref:PucR family transcriptional regulator n=1 Tax=Saccharopolyspora sp. NPDC050389 TaxID=3155516 RepID=UPI00340FFDE5